MDRFLRVILKYYQQGEIIIIIKNRKYRNITNQFKKVLRGFEMKKNIVANSFIIIITKWLFDII